LSSLFANAFINILQNKAYRAGKTVWQIEKELRGLRQGIDTWQAYVQRREEQLTATINKCAMHKVSGLLCSPLSSISFIVSCAAGFDTAHRLLE